MVKLGFGVYTLLDLGLQKLGLNLGLQPNLKLGLCDYTILKIGFRDYIQFEMGIKKYAPCIKSRLYWIIVSGL